MTAKTENAPVNNSFRTPSNMKILGQRLEIGSPISFILTKLKIDMEHFMKRMEPVITEIYEFEYPEKSKTWHIL